jgi:exopolysaccharide production protein ExoZ
VSADARPKSRFASIEAARGVAALLVVFHHASRIVLEPRFYGGGLPEAYLANLNVGVDFFFVLSGFIITWVHWGDIGRPGVLPSYARKRFLRIYPPYWGILFPLIALYLIFPDAGKPSQHDPLNILLSIVLLPNTVQPVLGVAWTLTHEMFFYAVFALAIARGVNVLRGMAAWAALIVIAHFIPGVPFPLSFVFSPFNLEFILGVGTAAYLKQHRVPVPGVLAIVSALCFLAVLFLAPHVQDDNLRGRLVFGGISALFVLGAVETERARPLNLGRPVLLMGAASYAIYLAHPVALSFGAHAITRALSMTPMVAMLVLAAFATAIGVAYHLIAEPALTRLARRWLVPGTKPAIPASPGDRPESV